MTTAATQPGVLRHVAVCVADLERAIARYTAYGLVCRRRTSRFAWLDGATAGILLVVATPPATPAPEWYAIGIGQICIATPDRHAWLAGIAGTDARPRAIAGSREGGHTYDTVIDDDGVVTASAEVPAAPPDTTPWLAQVAFVTTDAARLSRFYADLTGGVSTVGPRVRVAPADETGAAVDALPTWVQGGTVTYAIWEYRAPAPYIPDPVSAHRLGYRSLSFVVGDLTAVAAQCRASGAQRLHVLDGAEQWYDPDGNLFELIDARSPMAHALPSATDPERHRRYGGLQPPPR
ncbi:MAG: hypothetical protein RLZZ297_1476 [Chloroflexota bacterium]|jgi:catechol 2,3-dioxygenase-like lactoylglutathione lyase family enzyme